MSAYLRIDSGYNFTSNGTYTTSSSTVCRKLLSCGARTIIASLIFTDDSALTHVMSKGLLVDSEFVALIKLPTPDGFLPSESFVRDYINRENGTLTAGNRAEIRAKYFPKEEVLYKSEIQQMLHWADRLITGLVGLR